MTNTNKDYFPCLDLLRGPASLLVLLEHWRNLLFLDYASLSNPNILLKPIYLLTGLGHEAVIVFFVLSGTVISHVIYVLHSNKKWSWGKYIFDRISRLWIVLVPALLLTAFWDHLGIALSKDISQVYSGNSFGHIINSPVVNQLSLQAFLGNLFFLQTSYTPTYGSNGPLWSIAFEFNYYLIFPLFLFGLIRSRHQQNVGIPYLISAVFILLITTDSIRYNLIIWLMGVLSYALYIIKPLSGRKSGLLFSLGLGITLALLVCSRLNIVELKWDLIIALSTASTIYSALSIKDIPCSNPIVSVVLYSSKISYSMYLCHTPLLVFIASRLFVNNNSRWQPDVFHSLLALSILALVIFYTNLFWEVTEKQTSRVRYFVKSKFYTMRV